MRAVNEQTEGSIRPVGDDSHDWCFDCWVCGTNVRGEGTRFPSNTSPVSVTIDWRGSMPIVDRKLTCSPECAGSERAQAWKAERSAQPDAKQAASDHAERDQNQGRYSPL